MMNAECRMMNDEKRLIAHTVNASCHRNGDRSGNKGTGGWGLAMLTFPQSPAPSPDRAFLKCVLLDLQCEQLMFPGRFRLAILDGEV